MILRDIREGEYFGQYSAIDGKPRSAAIVAVSDTVVARMSAALFWEAIHRYPGVREGVLKALVADARALNERATEHANFDVRHRLCAELLRLSRTTGDDRVVVSPPPTHAELAARISTHREAVTKILNALERDGLIAPQPGRDRPHRCRGASTHRHGRDMMGGRAARPSETPPLTGRQKP